MPCQPRPADEEGKERERERREGTVKWRQRFRTLLRRSQHIVRGGNVSSVAHSRACGQSANAPYRARSRRWRTCPPARGWPCRPRQPWQRAPVWKGGRCQRGGRGASAAETSERGRAAAARRPDDTHLNRRVVVHGDQPVRPRALPRDIQVDVLALIVLQTRTRGGGRGGEEARKGSVGSPAPRSWYL